jgi:site-specific DNA-methyltransferase (adenine-specific)
VPKLPHSPEPSGRDAWSTPPEFYARLNREFAFRLDAAASDENSLCEEHLADALSAAWEGGPIFCNPPYGRIATPLWLTRGINEFQRTGATTVFLLPAATETRWFHDLAVPHAAEIRLIKGRLKFGNVLCKDGTVGEVSAPFPSAIIVLRASRVWRPFRPSVPTQCNIWAWDWRNE